MASSGWRDAFDVYAYALNTDTGETINLLNQTGSGTNDTGWQTVNVEIPTTGNYKFVFVSGTFDETFGTAAGASLYIDNVNVGAAPGALSYSQLLANLTEAGALTSIAMSEDGDTVSIADFGAESTAGQVRVYSWNGSAWIQKGVDLVGESPGDAVTKMCPIVLLITTLLMAVRYRCTPMLMFMGATYCMGPIWCQRNPSM